MGSWTIGARNGSEKKKIGTHLHDELDGTDEEAKELENVVLLLLLHPVVTVLATAGSNLGLGQTNTAVSLKHVLGDSAGTVGRPLLVLIFVLVAVLRLEILDQGIDVLVLIFRLILGGLGRGGLSGGRSVGGAVGALLVEATALDVGVQRRSAFNPVVSHGGR